MNCNRCDYPLKTTGQFIAGHEIFVCDCCGSLLTSPQDEPDIKDLLWLFRILAELENEQKITTRERISFVESTL